MQFALPPRKSSHPPPYERVSAKSAANLRRQRIQQTGFIVLGLLTLYLVLGRLWSAAVGRRDDGTISEGSSVLIVTVLDESTMSEDYIRIIKANRDFYASTHGMKWILPFCPRLIGAVIIGYQTFYTNVSTYAHLIESSPSSWATVPALRHALSLNPKIDYLWSLSPHALITNTTLSLYDHIFSRLATLMQKDLPVVPPDSVIHTFSHLRPSQAYFISTQDIDNIAHTSFLLRNSQVVPVPKGKSPETWTQFLLDAWFDPLYRTYSFQKAENHALEHIVQWHPTVLAKFVMIEQRLLNSYNYQPPKVLDSDTQKVRTHDSMWQPGDFVVNFKGCVESKRRDCEDEMRHYYQEWARIIKEREGRDVTVKLDTDDYVPSAHSPPSKEVQRPVGNKYTDNSPLKHKPSKQNKKEIDG